jgi:hypothetical protein
MWQYIVVYIIGILVVLHLIRKIYQFFFVKKTGSSPCAGCPGCALQNTNTSSAHFNRNTIIRGKK